MRTRHGSRVALLGGWLAALVVAASCRKPPPDEAVYTGARPTATTLPTSTTSTPAPSPLDGGPPSDAPAVDQPFTRAALLRSAADCTLGQARAFEVVAQALRDATRAHAQQRSAQSGAAARAAWVQAMASWQQSELFQLGPAAHASEPGGQDLRDQIYAWPLVSRCRVDEQLVAQAYAQPSFATSLVNGRGLSAIEYLLFRDDVTNACSSFSTINADGSWAALGPEQLGQRRADYAAAVADDIVARAAALRLAWEPTGGDFHRQLAQAGAGSAVYASEQAALNALSHTLFYADKQIKDWKVGRPVGLIDCFTGTCPEALESPYAQVSTLNVRLNLVAFRRVFAGCGEGGAGLGFDDWLRAVGAGELADRMLAALDAAQAAADALDPPLEQAISVAPDRVLALHAAVKGLTDPLKTEFITVLNLELPTTSEGDND